MDNYSDEKLEEYVKQHCAEAVNVFDEPFSDEMLKEYERECDKATSNLDAPLLGCVTSTICHSCIYSDFQTDPWKPQCKKYGDIPIKYERADSFDCPEYKIKPNCPKYFLPLHIQRQMEKD